MEKIIPFLAGWMCMLFFPILNFGQTDEIIRPGLIRATATLSPSYMFGNKQTFFYLHGNLEGYLTNSISAVGEGYAYLGNQSSDLSQIAYNHSLFFGISKHLVSKQHDAYIGIQPGISFTKMDAENNQLNTSRLGVNPLVSAVLGYNFYVNSVFHFFMQTRIIGGQHVYDKAQNLAEFRFSAGLGFHLQTIRKR